jgi:hypothetical protein
MKKFVFVFVFVFSLVAGKDERKRSERDVRNEIENSLVGDANIIEICTNKNNRPKWEDRLFRSESIEKVTLVTPSSPSSFLPLPLLPFP